MEKDPMAPLILKTKERQRRTTDLSEFDSRLKEMMDLNISLPVMLEWLEEDQNKETTLPALRRYVKRVFGDDFYEEFVTRNGWQKRRREGHAARKLPTKATDEPVSTTKATPAGKKTKSKTEPKEDTKTSDVDALKAVIHGNLDTSQYD